MSEPRKEDVEVLAKALYDCGPSDQITGLRDIATRLLRTGRISVLPVVPPGKVCVPMICDPPPEGYEDVGVLRVPQMGEWCVGECGSAYHAVARYTFNYRILRPLPKPLVKLVKNVSGEVGTYEGFTCPAAVGSRFYGQNALYTRPIAGYGVPVRLLADGIGVDARLNAAGEVAYEL